MFATVIVTLLVSSSSAACWNLAIPLGDESAIRNPIPAASPTEMRAREKNGMAVLHRLTRPKLAARRIAHPRAIWSYCVPGEPAC